MEQWLVRDHINTNSASAKEAVNNYDFMNNWIDVWVIQNIGVFTISPPSKGLPYKS